MLPFNSPFNQPEQPETESLRPLQPDTESLRWEPLQYPPALQQPSSIQPHVPPQIVYVYPQPSEPPPIETVTKIYTNAKDFRKDQKRLAQDGWAITKTTSYRLQQSFVRMVALGFIGAALFKPKSQIIVTYSRQVSQDIKSGSRSGRQ